MRGQAVGDNGWWPAGALVLVLALLVVVNGCVGSSSTDAPGGAAGAATRTQATEPPKTLRSDLLDIAEVRSFLVLGYDSRLQPLLDSKVFDLTTLSGPCGAAVKAPFGAPDRFRVFRSTKTTDVEAIAEPGASVGTALVEQLLADHREGCAAFTETLGNGPATQVHLTRMMTLPEVGERRVGWAQSVTSPDGSVVHRYVVVASAADRVLLLAVMGPDELPDQLLGPVVERAAAHA